MFTLYLLLQFLSKFYKVWFFLILGSKSCKWATKKNSEKSVQILGKSKNMSSLPRSGSHTTLDYIEGLLTSLVFRHPDITLVPGSKVQTYFTSNTHFRALFKGYLVLLGRIQPLNWDFLPKCLGSDILKTSKSQNITTETVGHSCFTFKRYEKFSFCLVMTSYG